MTRIICRRAELGGEGVEHQAQGRASTSGGTPTAANQSGRTRNAPLRPPAAVGRTQSGTAPRRRRLRRERPKNPPPAPHRRRLKAATPHLKSASKSPVRNPPHPKRSPCPTWARLNFLTILPPMGLILRPGSTLRCLPWKP